MTCSRRSTATLPPSSGDRSELLGMARRPAARQSRQMRTSAPRAATQEQDGRPSRWIISWSCKACMAAQSSIPCTVPPYLHDLGPSATHSLNCADRAIGALTTATKALATRAQILHFACGRQARTSYYVSVAAAAISLLTLASGAAVAVGLSATTGRSPWEVLATAGSVLSGFFAKTFLKSYQTASCQMSYYYGQPLVHCYLMHAQWLASETREHSGDPKEIRRWQEIIDASIKASAKAQDHLLSMQNPDLDKRGGGISWD